MKLLFVAGARPNFMKLAPLTRACNKFEISYEVVHTGQHYDLGLSKIFFEEFKLREPEYNLNVGSGSHAYQTAEIMKGFENVYKKTNPDIVVVVGDVNSTLACSLVVSKLNGKLAHVESGLRSFDRKMPEEINRVVTDCLSNFLFCTDQESYNFLTTHNDIVGKIYLVGDVMIDNLLYYISKIEEIQKIKPLILVTVHRQSNTDNKQNLEDILMALDILSKDFCVVFPIHPRTKKMISFYHFDNFLKNIECLEPLGYFDFLRYLKSARIVVTDSGSLQIETTVLNKYCLTLRENTERKFTITEGTNELVGTKYYKILEAVYRKMQGAKNVSNNLSKERLSLLDGKSSKRIIEILRQEKI